MKQVIPEEPSYRIRNDIDEDGRVFLLLEGDHTFFQARARIRQRTVLIDEGWFEFYLVRIYRIPGFARWYDDLLHDHVGSLFIHYWGESRIEIGLVETGPNYWGTNVNPQPRPRWEHHLPTHRIVPYNSDDEDMEDSD
jgi:hypothetical protein